MPSVSSFPKFPVGNPAAYVLNFMSSVWKALNPEATRRRTENLRRDKEGDHSGETRKGQNLNPVIPQIFCAESSVVKVLT